MKKITVFTLVLLVSTNCFGSERDFYDTAMAYYYLSILLAIFAFCLYFKLWGMANNVKKIKDEIHSHLSNLNYSESDPQKALLQKFISTVNTEYWKNVYKLAPGSDRNKIMDLSIKPYVEDLSTKLKSIDCELPDYIKKMERYKDFFYIYGK